MESDPDRLPERPLAVNGALTEYLPVTSNVYECLSCGSVVSGTGRVGHTSWRDLVSSLCAAVLRRTPT